MTLSSDHLPSSSCQPDRAELRQRLTAAGLRATTQRILILESLVLLPGHPTAEHVHRQVALSEPTVSLGTVYKTLDSFVAAGLSKRVASAEGPCRRYDSDCNAHHHLYCTDTKEIIDYSNPELDALIREFFATHGLGNFQPHSFSLHVAGSRTS